MGVVAATVGAAVVGGAIQGSAVRGAARTSAAAADAGIEEQRRQFDQTQRDLNPFLRTGQAALGRFNRELDQAPGVPQLQQFQGQAVAAPTIDRFGGQAIGAPQLQQGPQLEQFRFDPRQALNDPALQFQQRLGEQQVDRIAGKNRQLGSGARLLAAQEFGQGLASQSLGDEFSRQLAGTQQRNQAASQQFQQGLGRDVQQFGLQSQQLGQEQQINQLGNAQAIQQQGLDRQFLGDRLNLDQTEQRRLLTQFGLNNDQFNQRLNRLAGLVDVGARTGGNLASSGAQTAGNVSNLLAAQGNTQAAAQLGRANIVGNVLQQGVGAAAQGGFFNTPPPHHHYLRLSNLEQCQVASKLNY